MAAWRTRVEVAGFNGAFHTDEEAIEAAVAMSLGRDPNAVQAELALHRHAGGENDPVHRQIASVVQVCDSVEAKLAKLMDVPVSPPERKWSDGRIPRLTLAE